MDASRARVAMRGVRLLVAVFVAVLAGVLIWNVAHPRAGSRFVEGILTKRKPPAPLFVLPVIWRAGAAAPCGQRLALHALRGEPVVVNFWASWCDACKSEAPMLSATAAEYRGRVRFLGIDVQDKRAAALGFLRHYRQSYDSLQSSGSSVYTAWGLIGLPETFFVDPRGRTIAHAIGAMTHPNLHQAVDALLAADAATRPGVG